MILGKKERMAAVIVGIVAVAAAVHFLVFQQKAATYDQTRQEYDAAVQTLSTAEFIRDQQAFEQYQQNTTVYSELVTTVIEELNLQTLDLASSPPLGAVDQWGSQTIELLSQLNSQRQGPVKLTFLEQNGWNLPGSVPAVGGTGALADRVSQLNYTFQQLQFTTNNPQTEAQVRLQYNTNLQQLGIDPREVSDFYYQPWNLFFNNEEWITNFLNQSRSGGMGSSSGGLRPYYNYYGLHRFGQAIPALKKIWMYALITREMQGQNPDPNMMLRFGQALEIGIPLDDNEPLNSINKQLQALLDIIDIAARTGVQEIVQVKFLRPVNVGEAVLKVPGATPPPDATPAATPDMGMGMGMMGMDMMMMGEMGMGMGGPESLGAQATPIPDAEAVGTGAGVEIAVRADNAALTRFFFELSHVTRTYGIDDLYVYNSGQGGLLTTATIEVITDVNLDSAAGAAPVDGAPM